MKVLFLTRATLYTVFGGDTVQIISTAKYLRRLGIEVDIKLANENIDYSPYDLLHVFNAIRPADVLAHLKKSKKPYVLSTIFVDFSEYQQVHAKGLLKILCKLFSNNQLEYIKAIGRWAINGEKINSLEYIFSGHKKAVQKLANNASYLLPNSENEYLRFAKAYHISKPYKIVYNGVDEEVFSGQNYKENEARNSMNVICVARIEGKKNQLNLIKALNNTAFNLKLVGKPAPNHTKYYEECKAIAAQNISFESFVPMEELMEYYQNAKVHILPSWNETCGLSSLEAAYAGCNLVITNKGDTVEYFGKDAWYCDPSDLDSIYKAVAEAANSPVNMAVKEKIKTTYNWQQAAKDTLEVYRLVVEN
ncbi:MAG: glycosyltransferase family 4 protein [Bacteroidia bacterium]